MESNKTKTQPVALELGLTSERFEYAEMSENAEHYISKAKRKDRSYLKPDQWTQDGYAKTDICERLLNDCPDEIERINCEDFTPEEFIEKYESKNKPCIIKGLTKDWGVKRYWSFEEIYQTYKDEKFKVGEDDEGYPIRMKLKYFFEYMVLQKDDSPLYLFESSLEDRKEGKKLLKHFDVPKYFRDDLFSIMGDDRRPPFRWWAIGPRRSGSTVHIDPLLTSAWNTSLQGHKRWILFPQETPKHVVKGKQYLKPGQDYEAISYFAECVPKIKANDNVKTIEFIQYPGETVYVPGGWWHAVVNCDNTMAVTQNFVSYTNFETVWRTLRVERKKFSCKFLDQLKIKHPKLYEKAVQMNKEDNFIMYYDKKLLEKRYGTADLGDVVVKKNKGSSTDSSSSSSSSSSESESRSQSRTKE